METLVGLRGRCLIQRSLDCLEFDTKPESVEHTAWLIRALVGMQGLASLLGGSGRFSQCRESIAEPHAGEEVVQSAICAKGGFPSEVSQLLMV